MPKLMHRVPRMCRDRHKALVWINKRRVPLGTWGTDEAREAYDRVIAEWLSAGRELPAPTAEDEPPTVTEMMVAYTRYATDRYGPSELDTAKRALAVARKLYGTTDAETFGPKRLRTVRDEMIRMGWSRKHVNKQVGRIRAAFRWAASHEMVSERIHRRLETVPGLRRGEGGKERDRVKPVPQGDVRRIRPWLTRPIRGLIALQLLSGARAGELVGLRPVDIDTSGKVWTFTPEDHKTAHHDKTRTIYFGPRAQRVLKAFMRPGRPVDKPIFSPRESNAEAKRRNAAGSRRPNQKPNPVQSDREIGEAYTVASYRRAIHRACNNAFTPPRELKGEEREAWRKARQWSPHRLRHSAATSLRREFGLDVAAAILGHSSLAVTNTYAELNDKKAREVIAKVG